MDTAVHASAEKHNNNIFAQFETQPACEICVASGFWKLKAIPFIQV